MKVAIIGLDCATPQLVFGQFRNDLPNLSQLMDEGAWGLLKSTHPPITVPAWASMMSGRDPGQLGIYGFRNRKDYSYDGYAIANASAIKVDRVWDILSRAGKQVILLGVPQTYPVKPINGYTISDFLTPSTQSAYTHPPALKAEVEQVSGGYVFDVEGFRTSDKDALLQRIYDKTRKHFAVAKHLITTKPWDFFMMVEMGVDRIHHGFWSFMDPAHPKYESGNPYEHAIRDYYRYCDQEVGEVLALLPEETVIFVVSDHGAKKLEGGVCFNEWLIREGYLVLKEYPEKPTPIDQAKIDWSKTKAWGDGGYYGRLFLNVKGREPQGMIDPKDCESILEELRARIEALIPNTRAYRPKELYREANGVPPDLLVYFGDLAWRSVGTIGLNSLYTFENDTGPDEANHDWHGIFIMRSPQTAPKGELQDLSIFDIAPTILNQFGLEPPPMIGRSLL
jgi:predicted AlkP superfamily phosphohydrolase/phosphomutase